MSDTGPDFSFEGPGAGASAAASVFAAGSVIFVPNPLAIKALGTPQGPVGQWAVKAGREVQARAKQLAPVDTGQLRDSISMETTTTDEGSAVDVGTDVYYAGFQELGTSRNPPHPFLRPALIEVMESYGIGGGQSSWVGGVSSGTDVSFASPYGSGGPEGVAVGDDLG